MIRVDSFDNLINDICDFLSVNSRDLYFSITDFYQQSVVEGFFDFSFFYGLSSSYIDQHNNEPIDRIFFCHLTRNTDRPDILYPLQELLTTSNSFSHFLARKNFTFELDGKRILVYYNDILVDENYLGRQDDDNDYHGHLAYRLGYLDDIDFCVNGYLFGFNLQNAASDYYFSLQDGGELLSDFDKCFGLNLCEEFCKESTYYVAYSVVNNDEIIYDSNEDLSMYNRTKLYLTHCFLNIYSSVIKHFSIDYNPIIRLNDYQSIPVEHYQENGLDLE